MHRIMILIAPALMLAGCGKGAEQAGGEAAKEAPVAAAPAAPIRFQPGKWQATSELVSMDVPGMPPELAKRNVGQVTTFESCMTPEQAAKPQSDFFTNAKESSCKTEHFEMTGGTIAATMSCEDKHTPGKMTMKMLGNYTPVSYAATMTMERSDGPGGTTMKITAKTTGKRVGECA